MDRTSSVTAPTRLDAFLYATLGEDRNGVSLSVLSALARMDLDPWQEADELARLPVDAATHRLADLFRAIPDESLNHGDRSEVATRLIALLHADSSSGARTLLPSPRNPNGATIPPRIYVLLISLLVFLLLVAQV